MPKKVIVYGAGGHGKVVADVCLCAGFSVRGFIDDAQAADAPSAILGLPILGNWTWLRDEVDSRTTSVALGIGNNRTRQSVAERLAALGIDLATVIHPSAVVARSATVGLGSMVMAGAAINPDSRIGAGTIINTGVVVEHDNRIKDYAHLSANAATGGNVSIGALSHIGLGAVILPGLSVGRGTTVGAGAVVVNDVGDDTVVAGVPAKPLQG